METTPSPVESSAALMPKDGVVHDRVPEDRHAERVRRSGCHREADRLLPLVPARSGHRASRVGRHVRRGRDLARVRHRRRSSRRR